MTVLFADIVGFTGLSEDRDPEQVKNLVNNCFALLADDISAFGGRVDKVIGDAIVALFGAPIAHDDDAERAVRAALRMQETVGRFDSDTGVGIRLRIGVNTGEVLVGAISAGDDYTAMGDVVNLASRLQTAAEPGTVLVGSATQDSTAELIRYRSMGQLHARGRGEPVSAYRALAPYGLPGERRSAARIPLMGRDDEVALLCSTMAAAFGTHRSQLISVVGDSGVGKSRLAQEIVDHARFDNEAALLHGRCLPYGEANIWWPLAETISGAIGLTADATEAEARASIVSAVGFALGDRAEDIDLERVENGLLHVLGYSTVVAKLDAERATAEATRAIRLVLDKVASRGPIVWWISDLQWADDAVIALLDDVLERLSKRPLVVLATGTQQLFDRWNPRPGRFNVLALSLDSLSNEAMDELAQRLAPGLDAETRSAIVERSSGNPLFLEEMARMVSNDGHGSIDELPANVRSVIGARLDVLTDLARGVLGDAAVLGMGQDLDALRTMSTFTRGAGDISEPLEELSQAGLLDIGDTDWEFRSNVIREVVYDRLTKSDRAYKHAGVAYWIEANPGHGGPATIAWHYRQAATHSSDLGGVEGLDFDLADRGVQWTLEAARDVRASVSLSHVESLYTAALDLMSADDPRRASALADRALIAVRGLRLDAAENDLVLARACLVAGDDERRFRVHIVASELAQWRDELPKAMSEAQAALEIAHRLEVPGLLAEALRRRGMTQLFLGDHQEADNSIRESLDAYGEAGDANGMAWARQNLAWIAFMQGRMGEAEQRLAAASEAFSVTGDKEGQAWTSGLLAYVRIYQGRFREADQLARVALEDALEQGDAWGRGMMNVALATSALWSGRVDDALAHTEQALSALPEGTETVGRTQATAVRGRALVRLGRVDQGLALLETATVDQLAGPPHEMLTTALTAAAAMVGDLERAERNASEFGDFDPQMIGEAERRIVEAMVALQSADLVQASAILEALPMPSAKGGSTWGWAVLALIRAGAGRDIDDLVDAVETSGRATYSDRMLVRLAVAVVAARAGDATATRIATGRARDAVPPGGDRVGPALIGLAEALMLTAIGADDALARTAEADATLDDLGLGETAWRDGFGALLDPVST